MQTSCGTVVLDRIALESSRSVVLEKGGVSWLSHGTLFVVGKMMMDNGTVLCAKLHHASSEREETDEGGRQLANQPEGGSRRFSFLSSFLSFFHSCCSGVLPDSGPWDLTVSTTAGSRTRTPCHALRSASWTREDFPVPLFPDLVSAGPA